MPTVADYFDVVIGVDTHADTHSYAVLSPTGGVVEEVTLPSTADGLAAALGLTTLDPSVVAFSVEGTGSYGLGLTRVLHQGGYTVIEAEQPTRKARRGKGKSDPIDARLAARNVLDYDIAALPTPRADGPRAGLAVLLTARRDMTDERTQKINALKALLRAGTPAEHALAASTVTTTWLNQITRRRGREGDSADVAIGRAEARRLAVRIRETDRELKANKNQLTDLVDQLTPGLLDQVGIGPVSAAQAIVSYSHHGRVRHEAAYAKLAGAAPLDASSGKQQRHRLNRGGDRALNRALHDIIKTRMRCCETTRAYVDRRRAEGKTTSEIRRSLKRYLARQLYRQLTKAPALTLDNT
jgi:transposase